MSNIPGMHHYFKYFVTFLLLQTSVHGVWGQNQAEFRHFTTRDGLTKSYVKSILQDHKGFLWIGTNDGLNRYDGYEFRAYRGKPGKEHSLSSNEINVILEDSWQQIWIGTNGGGLNKYLPGEDAFTAYTTVNSNLNNNLILSLFEDKQGLLWIGTNEGISYYNRNSDTFTTPGEAGKSYVISSIIEDSRGRIWMGTNSGLGLFDRKRNLLVFPSADILKPSIISSVIEDQEGRLWLGTSFHGVVVVEVPADIRHLRVVEHFTHDSHQAGSLGSNMILTLFEDHLNNIWVGTDLGGLNKYDKERGTFIRYRNDNRVESSISSNNILSIEEDHLGNLWIGTNFGGLNFMERNQIFEHFKSNPYHYVSSPVLSIYVDQEQNLWMGTDGNGLSRISPAGEFVQYISKGSEESSVGGNTIQKIYEDKKGNLWLGTYNHGLSILQKNGKFRQFKSDDGSGLSNDDIRAILTDAQGNLWIGTNGGGLNLYDQKKEQFTVFKEDLKDNHALSSDSIVCLHEDSRGLIWVGTVHGSVCFFDPGLMSEEKINFYHIDLPVEDSEKFYGNSVISITEDVEGNMWFGNYVSGLTKMVFSSRSLKQYDESDGLPGNTINGLLPDEDGSVWISTNQGLARYYPQTDTFQVYNELDGLQGNEFLHGAFYKSANGKLYFGGINGVNAFYPDSIKENTYIPEVVITGMKAFNEPVSYNEPGSASKKQISENRQIILEHNQSTFTFEFVALSYPFAEKNQYAVMLQGFENQWRTIGTDRSATYTNISPGNYIFKVKGSNSDGFWNNEGTFVKIKILTPWWRTGWAYLVYAIILGGILYVAVSLTVKRTQLNERLRLVEREKEYEHHMYQSKIDFFTNVSHEFRTPLTLILSPLEKIVRETKDPFKNQHNLMYKNARLLLRLVDQVLDFRKVNNGSLKLKVSRIDLVDFARKVCHLFQDLSVQKQVSFSFSSAVSQLPAYVDIDKIEKVIYNLLSNAFKFIPEHGKISFHISVKQGEEAEALARQVENMPASLLPGFAEIEVSDSGKGIPPEELDKIFLRFYQVESNGQSAPSGTGIGLSLTSELVGLHHGMIRVESKPGRGSAFKVWLPLDKSCFEQYGITETDGDQTLDNILAQELVGLDGRLPLPLETNEAEAQSSDTPSLPLVLIVDDNADIRLLLRENLRDAFRIEEAANGQEAILIAQEQQPELIVSDVMMPAMDGYALCKKLKNDIHTSHIPVILLTARNTVDEQIKGIETGADAYITKPFSLSFLEVRIRKLIESRKKLRERFLKNEVLTPEELAVSSVDEIFLRNIKDILEKQIANPVFKIEDFCKEIGMSHTQLYTKVKALTGFSPNELIKDFRLKRAAQLLRDSDQTINEVALSAGFNDAKYFSRCFRKQFGKTPTDFIHEHRMKV